MTALAEELRFEEAQEIKIKYDLIENIELKAKSYHLCFIILMCSTSKAKKGGIHQLPTCYKWLHQSSLYF